MGYFLGAYAASANVSGWDAQLEADYYRGLAGLTEVRGLEHPFLGQLHQHDDAWFLQHLAPHWDYVFTTIPGVMNALATEPSFGLASTDPAGRQAALDFMQAARQAILQLNQHLGRQAVKAIMLHTAPARDKVAGSAACFMASMQQLLSWDWQGAQLLVEHCDAYLPPQLPSKGFLSLSDELAVLSQLKQQGAAPVGVVINWGRSVFEGRDPAAAIAHIQAAKDAGLLAGLMFSGVSGEDSAYGAWRDSHQPIRNTQAPELGSVCSWLTEQQVGAALMAASPVEHLTVLGLKIGVRPVTATVAERLTLLQAQLQILTQQQALITSISPVNGSI